MTTQLLLALLFANPSSAAGQVPADPDRMGQDQIDPIPRENQSPDTAGRVDANGHGAKARFQNGGQKAAA